MQIQETIDGLRDAAEEADRAVKAGHQDTAEDYLARAWAILDEWHPKHTEPSDEPDTTDQ